MTMTRRSVMWPLIIVALGCVWLLMVAGAFPVAVEDVLKRAWPALLILFGLDVLAGQRRVRFAGRAIPLSVLAVVGMIAALVGVVWLAYRHQADVLRSDTQVTLDETLPEEIERVVIGLDLKRTGISIATADDERQLAVRFSGSEESQVDMDLEVDGTIARLTVTEAYRHSIPRLADYGRGTISVVIPRGITIEQLNIALQQGDMVLELRHSLVQSLAVETRQGDVILSVPDQVALVGNLRVGGGDLTVNVALPLALSISRGSGSGIPRYSYDPDRYFLLADGDLKRQNSTEYNVALTVWMDSRATLTVADVE